MVPRLAYSLGYRFPPFYCCFSIYMTFSKTKIFIFRGLWPQKGITPKLNFENKHVLPNIYWVSKFFSLHTNNNSVTYSMSDRCKQCLPYHHKTDGYYNNKSVAQFHNRTIGKLLVIIHSKTPSIPRGLRFCNGRLV